MERNSFSHHRSALIAGLIFLGVVLWMLSGVFSDSDSHQVGEAAAQQANEMASVRVLDSRHQVIRDQVIINGRTLADRSVSVKAETDGVVRQLHFKRGDRVSAGDLLAELAIESREARLQEARSLLERAEIEFRGAQQLRKQDSISQTELAQARAALDSARAQLNMAVSEVERTRITAPVAGLIETRDVEEGDFLSRGAPVATVVDLSPIRVKGSLSERYLNRIEVGSPAEVRLVNGSVHKGEVTFVGRVASAATEAASKACVVFIVLSPILCDLLVSGKNLPDIRMGRDCDGDVRVLCQLRGERVDTAPAGNAIDWFFVIQKWSGRGYATAESLGYSHRTLRLLLQKDDYDKRSLSCVSRPSRPCPTLQTSRYAPTSQ